jgi:hypothetical protein
MLMYVIALALIMHGLAHAAGFAASWSANSAGFSSRPSILPSGIVLHSPVGRAFGLLWLVAMVGLVGAGLGLVFHQPWWPALAIAAAVISLVAIVPWWNTVPPGAKVGAAFDVLLVLALALPWNAPVIELLR